MDEYADGEVPGTGSGVVTTEAAAPATPTPLTPLAFRYLDQTRPWVRFMSIVTFVAAGLMVVLGSLTLVVALFGGFAGPGAPVAGVFAGGVVGALMSLFYIMGAVLYVVPGVYLSRYARAIQRLKQENLPGLSITPERRIPDEWEADWALSTGRDPQASREALASQHELVLHKDGLEAIGAANHFQFIAPRQVLLEALPGEWSGDRTILRKFGLPVETRQILARKLALPVEASGQPDSLSDVWRVYRTLSALFGDEWRVIPIAAVIDFLDAWDVQSAMGMELIDTWRVLPPQLLTLWSGDIQLPSATMEKD